MEDDDAPPAIDWLGNPVSCRDCPHEENRVSGLCDLGRACVRDLRSRRIDRFFSINPGLADSYLDHPFFEVRSIAARYASPFRLLPLLSDIEPDVRAMAVFIVRAATGEEGAAAHIDVEVGVRQVDPAVDDPGSGEIARPAAVHTRDTPRGRLRR
ncbi:MAG: hypothetical protein IE917_18080 [Betaproteobacteria bacterium]|nr:hypothetical protein [Betaproteobacteria bacterium]